MSRKTGTVSNLSGDLNAHWTEYRNILGSTSTRTILDIHYNIATVNHMTNVSSTGFHTIISRLKVFKYLESPIITKVQQSYQNVSPR